ncbi:MAG: hypothetical protein IGS54_19990 [Elainella sp. C42_A2020_010]|nr:hypothetical protein [Elainella sp. C42_A2020_010]
MNGGRWVIRIRKSDAVPDKLAQDGKHKRRSHSVAYSRDPEAYQSGKKTFSFASSIYAHESVKQALIAAQRQKCCFCERLIGTDGDVEHFRPKQAYKQALGEPLQRPGYYWLAYEWDNLYLSCPSCNQRHKQNLFPLQNPAERATDHKQPIEREQPLFIDPGKEDPEAFIGFRGEIAFAIDGSQKGQATIDSLKLNQRSLPGARLQRLQLLRELDNVIKLAADRPDDDKFQEQAKKAKDLLERAIQDDAEFSAAARWAIRTNFEFVLG